MIASWTSFFCSYAGCGNLNNEDASGKDVYGFFSTSVCVCVRAIKGGCKRVCTSLRVRKSKYAVKEIAVCYLLISLTTETKGESKLTHTLAILQQDETEGKRDGEQAEV